jgi:hypothetical protein
MRTFFFWLVGCTIVSTSLAEDFQTEHLHNWHQWRGPHADGLAPHGDPAIEWGEKKNIQWKVEMPGEGHASPIVWDNQVFVLAAVKTAREVEALEPPKAEPPGGYKTPRPTAYYRFVAMSLDRTTGEIQWQRKACEVLPHEGRHGTNTYASASPTTDGRRLYVSFGSHGIFCYDLNGEKLWQRDLGDMVTRFGWGEATSPVIYGDSLIVNWDHEGDSFLGPSTGSPRASTHRRRSSAARCSCEDEVICTRSSRSKETTNICRSFVVSLNSLGRPENTQLHIFRVIRVFPGSIVLPSRQ